jgi:hypothetical protein
MPSEVSIAKALSGSECLESLIHSLRETLGRDDRFSSHMAYSGFKAEIRVKFTPVMSFIPEVDRTIHAFSGDQPDPEESPILDVTYAMEPKPPNQVREEADLPQPVLVTDGEGRTTEKWVKKGNAPKQVGKPKFVGGQTR